MFLTNKINDRSSTKKCLFNLKNKGKFLSNHCHYQEQVSLLIFTLHTNTTY